MSISLLEIRDFEDKTSPLKNRIRKNYKHLRKWAQRRETDCFRIYDRDIKEYPVAIDYYAGRFCVHYFSFAQDREERLQERKEEIEHTLHSLFQISPREIFSRMRIRRKKIEQYEKKGAEEEFFTVREYGVKFEVNLSDYLDTGLFLDHRETRRLVSSVAHGKSVLNLFAYTCAFSVHAAHSGAVFTKSVDLSTTYTNWGRRNFLLNGISLDNHPIVRADCLKFLEEEGRTSTKYDLIIIDPPTLSRSKKMVSFFDIQRDYVPLIEKALPLLNFSGTLFFSTNFRDFRFDSTPFNNYHIEEISDKTVPLDFHNQKIHRCWKIRLKDGAVK